MEQSFFLLAATFLPLLTAPIAFALGRKSSVNATVWFSFGVLAVSTALLLLPAMGLTGSQSYSETYKWGQFGDFGLRLDGISIPFAFLIYLAATIIALFSKPYMVRKLTDDLSTPARTASGEGPYPGSTGPADTASSEEMTPPPGIGANAYSTSATQVTVLETQRQVNRQMGLYYALYLAFSMGMLGTVLATNLIEFYVFFELMLVPSFFLVALFGYGARSRVALMFLFWTHVGAAVLLLGLLAMGFFAGGFDYATVKENAAKIPAQWLSLIVFALVVGLGVKLAAFLFHIWLPHTYAQAPTPISALLSSAMTGIGAYGLLRLWMELLGGSYDQYSLYINIWGLATMIYGGAMALMQDDIKKVLAYSSISQMGYILFGLGSGSVLGISGATLLFVTHGLAKAALFMMAGSVILQTGTVRMSKLGGLAGKMPYTAVFAMIAGLTLIGIPPTSGFMSEWVMFNGVLQTATHNHDSVRATLFALGILATILSTAYLLWMYKRIFFGKIPEELAHVKDSGRYVTVTMAAFAAITLIIGVIPDMLLSPIVGYVQGMFGPAQSTVLPVPVPGQAAAMMSGPPSSGGAGAPGSGG